jgi:hypothetical protein
LGDDCPFNLGGYQPVVATVNPANLQRFGVSDAVFTNLASAPDPIYATWALKDIDGNVIASWTGDIRQQVDQYPVRCIGSSQCRTDLIPR